MVKPAHKIRIIGGLWRGRKLTVLDSLGLRPSSDRLRETLFNWLMPIITGARCLDLFAGTGALGLEAASRGAASVVFVEQNQSVANKLQQHILLLNASQVQLHCTDALTFLQHDVGQPFDVLFLDPPFASTLLADSVNLLQYNNILAENACIYVEQAKSQTLLVPPQWRLLKQKITAQVRVFLFQV
jgi:16S rRNA (guanine966-N2)-methyltransferase